MPINDNISQYTLLTNKSLTRIVGGKKKISIYTKLKRSFGSWAHGYGNPLF